MQITRWPRPNGRILPTPDDDDDGDDIRRLPSNKPCYVFPYHGFLRALVKSGCADLRMLRLDKGWD